MALRNRRSRAARIRVGLALAAALVCLGIAPRAASAKRVVVLDFSGPRSGQFQAAVEQIVRQRHQVMGHQRYVAAARRMGATRPTPDNVSRVARRIRADGLVIGVVERRGPRYTLTVRVRAGANGRFIETIKITTRRPRLTPADRRKLRARLNVALRRLPPLGRDRGRRDRNRDRRGGDRRDDEEIIEDDVVEEEFIEEDDDVALRDDEVDDADGDVAIEADDEEETPLSEERKRDLAIRGSGLDAAAGMSFTGRDLSFTFNENLGDAAPQGYDGTPVAGIYIRAELYPLAFDDEREGFLRNLGVTALYDRVIKISSKLRYTDPMTMEELTATLGTTQARWGVGAVFRHNFGSKPTKPSIKVSLRVNKLTFDIDKDDAPMGVVPDIPNVDYLYIDPGAGIRVPFTSKIAMSANAYFLYVFDAGDMQAADQYGDAKITGFEADASLSYMITSKITLEAGGMFRQIGFDFSGNGDLTNNRDGDPTDVEVGGAADRYLGGFVTAGYLF